MSLLLTSAFTRSGRLQIGELRSGSARIIYMYLKIHDRILLVDIYKKTDRDTLSHQQKRWLKALALILKS